MLGESSVYETAMWSISFGVEDWDIEWQKSLRSGVYGDLLFAASVVHRTAWGEGQPVETRGAASPGILCS